MTRHRIRISIDCETINSREEFREAVGVHANSVLAKVIDDLTYIAKRYGEGAIVNIKEGHVSLREAYDKFNEEVYSDFGRSIQRP